MFACVVCAALDDVSRTSCMILKQLEVMLPKIRTQSVVAYTDAPAHQTSNTSFDKHQSEHIFYHSLSRRRRRRRGSSFDWRALFLWWHLQRRTVS